MKQMIDAMIFLLPVERGFWCERRTRSVTRGMRFSFSMMVAMIIPSRMRPGIGADSREGSSEDQGHHDHYDKALHGRIIWLPGR